MRGKKYNGMYALATAKAVFSEKHFEIYHGLKHFCYGNEAGHCTVVLWVVDLKKYVLLPS